MLSNCNFLYIFTLFNLHINLFLKALFRNVPNLHVDNKFLRWTRKLEMDFTILFCIIKMITFWSPKVFWFEMFQQQMLKFLKTIHLVSVRKSPRTSSSVSFKQFYRTITSVFLKLKDHIATDLFIFTIHWSHEVFEYWFFKMSDICKYICIIVDRKTYMHI